MHDVVVVGAGPTGSYSALECAKAGLDVLLIDSTKFPRDKACGGVVGEKAIKLIGKDILSTCENEAFRNDFYYDWKFLGYLESHVYYFKRMKFDQCLVQMATKAGAKLKENVTVIGVEHGSNCVSIKTRKGLVRGKMVIGADGVNSMVGRSLGLTHYDDTCRYASMKAEIDISYDVARELDIVTPTRQNTYFFSNLIGFAWLIPNRGSVNAGYGCTVTRAKDLKRRFHDFLDHFDLKPQRERGGQIPFMTLRRIYAERVLLTGDAGGFVNPWTGAGIGDGIIAADKAVRVCKEAIDSDDFSLGMMSKYQELCHDQMKRINWRGNWIKALDLIAPRDVVFPFWVRMIITQLGGLASGNINRTQALTH